MSIINKDIPMCVRSQLNRLNQWTYYEFLQNFHPICIFLVNTWVQEIILKTRPILVNKFVLNSLQEKCSTVFKEIMFKICHGVHYDVVYKPFFYMVSCCWVRSVKTNIVQICFMEPRPYRIFSMLIQRETSKISLNIMKNLNQCRCRKGHVERWYNADLRR